MGSYFDEHPIPDSDDHLAIARLILVGGWADQLGLSFESLVGDQTRPAHPDAIKELERVVIEDIRDQQGQCLICLDKWENADERETAIKMPCGHLYHSKCVLEWLKKANTCPACRKELPSHDPLYEEWKRQEKRKKERQADLDELHNSMFS